jgi:hypothetical protein
MGIDPKTLRDIVRKTRLEDPGSSAGLSRRVPGSLE